MYNFLDNNDSFYILDLFFGYLLFNIVISEQKQQIQSKIIEHGIIRSEWPFTNKASTIHGHVELQYHASAVRYVVYLRGGKNNE